MIVLALGLHSSAVFAQSQVRVIGDRVTIWRREARTIPATTVRTGTVLEVTGRDGDWFVVVVPRENGGNGEVGLIAASQVEVIGGAVAPSPSDSPRGNPPTVNARPGAPARTGQPPSVPHDVEVFGFGDVAYGKWLAHDTFNAVLGSPGGPLFGGGVQVRFGSLFVEGSVERFQKTGSRVFVADGDVFTLNIADTIRVIPITATFGYRRAGRQITPYVGGGIGTYLYRETSDFAEASENVNEHFTSYHVLGGVEFAGRTWLRVGVEAEYTTVPSALG